MMPLENETFGVPPKTDAVYNKKEALHWLLHFGGTLPAHNRCHKKGSILLAAKFCCCLTSNASFTCQTF